MQPDQQPDSNQNTPTQEPSTSESSQNTPNTPQANTFSASPMPGVQPDTNYAVPPQANKTNGMAIAGFVLAFLLPLLGLIFSIIGVNKAKKTGTGKGLAIAGIVISAISIFFIFPFILSVILLSTSGLQRNARDTERTNDINYIHSELESFYNQNQYYPAALSELTAIDAMALAPPEGSPFSYTYEPQPTGCTKCQQYILSTQMESGNTYSKNSLN
jgi:hypothetical protein